MEKIKESFKFILLSLSALLCAACGSEQREVRETIPFVSGILEDPDCREYAMLASHVVPEVKADIYILGPAERCSALCSRFSSYDRNDNVDGSDVADGLPDFAGETVSAVFDIVNTPYSSFIENGSEDRLREVTVRNVLAAIDTVCFLSPYDMDGMSAKQSAKVIILASPYADAFGFFDADTLLNSTGCAVKLLSPLSAMFEHLFLTHEGKLNVGIIPNQDVTASGIYESIFFEVAHKYGREDCGCVVYSPAYGEDPIRSFLDNCLEDGMTGQLDAIMVDDFNVDMEASALTLEKLTSVMSEESLVYRNCVSDNFELMDGNTEVLEACYRYLRATNTFTHNIYYPKSGYFITVNSPEPDTLSYKLMKYDEQFVQMQH